MTRARRKGSGLRTHRRGMRHESAIVAGDPRCREVVYGYGFPSCPGRIKIGYSSRGLRRVAEQSTAFPERPVLHFVIHDPRAKSLEAAFHAALADRQSDTMGVEWFDVSVRDCLAVSPALRRASGRAAARLRHRLALFAALAGLSGLLYAPLALSLMALTTDWQAPLSQIWSGWAAMAADLRVLDMAAETRRAATAVSAADLPPLLRLVPAGLSALPLFLPVLFRRPQAK